ncbi:MAG TPA: response regulator [Thermoanaerobaculia bacterium]|nr:response regulator [Thermoanaerobaculia bacterium]
MRILLIDDDVTVTDNLKIFLEHAFHTVDSLTWIDGKEMLEDFLANFVPQGVILDYGMSPSGTEIYRWIKQWKMIPIAFYTSYAQSQEHLRAMTNAGARIDQIIEKSEVGLDISALLRALEA